MNALADLTEFVRVNAERTRQTRKRFGFEEGTLWVTIPAATWNAVFAAAVGDAEELIRERVQARDLKLQRIEVANDGSRVAIFWNGGARSTFLPQSTTTNKLLKPTWNYNA